MTTVIVVHGLWLPGSETLSLRHRLRAAGYSPVLFRYRTLADDLDTSAARLADFVSASTDDTIHLVGHSLGGLVIFKMLKAHDDPRIGRAVCIGSPFTGSVSGRNLLRLPGGARLLGRAMAQCLAEAPGWRWNSRRELGIIAGSRALGAGRLIGHLPAPSDGTVSVAETRLPGASDHLVLPVTHFSMLWSRAVADQVIAFLRRGRFDRV